MSNDLASLYIRVDSSGVVTASKDLNKLTDDSKKTEKATESVTAGFSKLKAVVIALGGAYATMKMAQYIRDATMLAARYETLGVVMRIVGNNAGYSGAQMDVYARGLQRAGIAMVESRNTLARMIQAQIALTSSQKLARIAQDAAVIGNLNSSQSFEQMIHGLQTGMPRILRTIGLNVDFNASEIALAASLGKKRDALSEAEVMQGRVNAVIKAGILIEGSYEGAMETAGKQVLSLTRHLDNLKVLLGAVFTPALAEIIGTITGNIKDLNGDLEKNAEKWADWGNSIRLVIIRAEIELQDLLLGIDRASIGIAAIGLLYAGPGALIGKIPGLEGAGDHFKFFADMMIGATDGVVDHVNEIDNLTAKYNALVIAMTPAGKAAAKAAADALEVIRLKAAKLAKEAEDAAEKARIKNEADAKEQIALMKEVAEAQKEFNDALILGGGTGSIVESQLRGGVGDNLKKDPISDDYLDKLAEAASYYENLIGFEDTYHEKMLELIEARRVADIAKTQDVAAADAKAHAAQMELLEKKFEHENKYVNSTIDNTGKMLDAAMSMYDKDSSEYKRLADFKKGVQVAELAMEAAKNIQIIAGYFAKSTAAVASAAIQNTANTSTAITGAASSVAAQGSVPIVGFALAAAMLAFMAAVLGMAGIAFGGGGGGAASAPSLPKSTVLGAADGTGSESISKSWELLEDTYDMQYRELSGIHREMKDLNDNITGLVSSILRTGGFGDMGIATGETLGSMEKFSNAVNMGTDFGIIGKLAGSIFGGKTTTAITGTGIATGGASIGSLIGGGGVGGQQYSDVYTKTKGGWFRSDKESRYTVFQALDDNVSRILDKVFQNMSATLVELTLGLGTDMNATLNHVFSGAKINLAGMSGDEMNKALSEHFSAMGDNAVDALFGHILRQYQQVGEGMLETATRILIDKEVVLDTLKITGQAFYGGTLSIIEFSEAIIRMAGDLDTLRESAESYYDKFFSDEEKQIRLQEQLTGVLEDMNLVLPGTRAGYRNLVESLNLNTKAGQRAYVTLLKLAEGADDFYSGLEDIAQAALTASQNVLDIAEQNLRNAFASQIEILNDSLGETRNIISDLSSAVGKLRSAREGMSLAGNEIQDFSQAVAEVGVALAKARTGDFSGLSGLDSAISTSANVPMNQYATTADYQRAYWASYRQLAELEALTADQLSVEEQAAVDRATQIELLEAQLNALLGIDTSVLSVKDATEAFKAAQVAVAQAQVSVAATSDKELVGIALTTEEALAVAREQQALAALQLESQRTLTAQAELARVQSQLVQAQFDLAAANAATAAAAGQGGSDWWNPFSWAKGGAFSHGRVTPFAAGDIFNSPHLFPMANGMGLLGEAGPEAIMPLTRIGGNLGVKSAGGDNVILIAEVRALRAEVKAGNLAIARSTAKTAKVLTDFDYNGMPAEREIN